ncbi:MAG: 16S rRNA (cytidine(1402)-2'-O)-methyltransferase [Candidatus Magasanikbacteria bacterium CG10_big_fil_rev_8_21_14_0_10_42_10]|uniref:Ribosomal RNA small subunit methyltransferase I n=2 Tax=Candidatus Magasanikiibacteriota TaxID=1752731 RepID=A0A2H0TX43_9BACT|nr:MAG: 16S rRNA (cytidine(1402)-2'-O)-methyltransferase [Candidatus Magasanikbacteria bacterium CG10_big_fil_rev_8_21_14_0_10_42_10]PIZ94749.1 MAG: 16S rRNA (cytidine(1402)-2'-O)-methyltransferase [Candidatus Magasanikbacteria bacterium CG_4_10_14_0_2_um_filter_41_10]
MLSIIATPIGNLGDITLRALEVLKTADIILCEDTRVTKKLLSHYEINTPTMSYHQHSDEKKIREILSLLDDGKHLALVTDAGTPGISDPGNRLIHDVISSDPERLKGAEGESRDLDAETRFLPDSIGTRNDVVVQPIPGPSAVIAALSISGLPTDKFIFMGFPPHKKGRETFFREVADAKYTVAFYESNHRIKKAIGQLGNVLEGDREVVICRELTKKFETVYRGSIEEVAKMNIVEKGEFVVLVRGSR